MPSKDKRPFPRLLWLRTFYMFSMDRSVNLNGKFLKGHLSPNTLHSFSMKRIPCVGPLWTKELLIVLYGLNTIQKFTMDRKPFGDLLCLGRLSKEQ